jgi:type IV secretory pathway protease TraF
MKLTPGSAIRWSRYAVYVALALLLWRGLPEVHFTRVREGDDGTPSLEAGTLVMVRTVEEDGELLADSLYFLRYPDESGTFVPRLARLVALPGEQVSLQGDQVFVSDRVLPLPARQARSWPNQVPAGECLVLTDAIDAGHPDSRQLGTIPLRQLLWRVVVALDL